MKNPDVIESVSSFLQNLENQIGEVATRLDRAVTQFVKLHEGSERLPNKVTLWKELDVIGDVLEGLSQKGESWATRVEMSRQQLPSQVTQKIFTECQAKFTEMANRLSILEVTLEAFHDRLEQELASKVPANLMQLGRKQERYATTFGGSLVKMN